MKRRQFIANASTGALASRTELWRYLAAAFATALAAPGRAQAQAGTPFNYLLFLHPGAPPRWTNDGFLSPNLQVVDGAANAEFIPHPVVKNVAKDGGTYLTAKTNDNDKMTYETTTTPVSYKDRANQDATIYLPKLWDISLPEWNGSAAEIAGMNPLLMRDLVNEMMIIRGFHLLADFGHFRGPSLLSQPVASAPSISGLVADLASAGGRLVPAIGLTDSPGRPLGYRAPAAPLTLGPNGGGSNRAGDLLSSFLRTGLGAGHAANRALIDSAYQAAIAAYKDDAVAANPAMAGLYDNTAAVDQLVAKLSSIDITGEYNTAKAKYTALIRECCRMVPGLLGELKLNTDGGGNITSVPYMSEAYADKFAIAEVFIKNEITGSFTFICNKSAVPGSYVGYSNNPHGAQNDEHTLTDRMQSAFAHNWLYRSWMACANQLKLAIGNTDWEKTVLQFGAEYNRSPNAGSGGSDHAINACVTSIMSGALDSFIPIGNIQRTHVTDPAHNNYGTYGVGAATNIEGKGDAIISAEYVASTVMKLMGISSPFRDDTDLIKKTNGSWRPRTERPKNV